MPDIFNTNAQPDLAAPTGQINAKALLQFGQQPVKQSASTGTQATQKQLNEQAARQVGNNLGAALYRLMQGPQGQQQAPVTWNVTPQPPPQQQVGPPMNIVPQGYGYR